VPAHFHGRVEIVEPTENCDDQSGTGHAAAGAEQPARTSAKGETRAGLATVEFGAGAPRSADQILRSVAGNRALAV